MHLALDPLNVSPALLPVKLETIIVTQLKSYPGHTCLEFIGIRCEFEIATPEIDEKAARSNLAMAARHSRFRSAIAASRSKK